MFLTQRHRVTEKKNKDIRTNKVRPRKTLWRSRFDNSTGSVASVPTRLSAEFCKFLGFACPKSSPGKKSAVLLVKSDHEIFDSPPTSHDRRRWAVHPHCARRRSQTELPVSPHRRSELRVSEPYRQHVH